MGRRLIALGAIVAVIGVGIWAFATYTVPEISGGIKTTTDIVTDATGEAAETITETVSETVTEVTPHAEQVVGTVTENVVDAVAKVVENPEMITDAVINLLPDAVGPYVLQGGEDPPASYPAVPKAEEEPTQDGPLNSEPAMPLISDYPDSPQAQSDDAGFIAEVERYVYLFTNVERESQGLDPLRRSALVDGIARAHSQDMADRGYFRHVTPEGLDPTDRGMKSGYDCTNDYGSYYTYGLAENISWVSGIRHGETAGDVAQDTVTGWMNSPGHRANILKPSYDRIGVGVAFSDDGEMYATQNFC